MIFNSATKDAAATLIQWSKVGRYPIDRSCVNNGLSLHLLLLSSIDRWIIDMRLASGEWASAVFTSVPMRWLSRDMRLADDRLMPILTLRRTTPWPWLYWAWSLGNLVSVAIATIPCGIGYSYPFKSHCGLVIAKSRCRRWYFYQ